MPVEFATNTMLSSGEYAVTPMNSWLGTPSRWKSPPTESVRVWRGPAAMLSRSKRWTVPFFCSTMSCGGQSGAWNSIGVLPRSSSPMSTGSAFPLTKWRSEVSRTTESPHGVFSGFAAMLPVAA